jgi:hypothetical protein
MSKLGALIFGTLVATVTTSAFADDQVPANSSINHPFVASITAGVSEPSNGQSRPLFKIGGLSVRADAPVEPPYNAAANRNLAADPLWGPGL